jgi:branched-chain amino acid transport system ATP-binding protein
MALLETRDLTAFYGDFQALFGISVTVEQGETVAIIGANGAGKSTFLKTVAGLLPSTPGSVMFDGADISGTKAYDNLAHGLVLVPEGRKLFPSLSVQENLLVGAHRRSGKWTLARIYELFPVLAERRHQPATTLSGGQQQMCAIGRGLMGDPSWPRADRHP